jgi:hypothetical protein
MIDPTKIPAWLRELDVLCGLWRKEAMESDGGYVDGVMWCVHDLANYVRKHAERLSSSTEPLDSTTLPGG